MKLYFSENLNKIDKESYSSFGYSENVLMENAGGGCYRELLKLYDKNILAKTNFAVICGKGNNGGDGLVLSKYLFNGGFNVKVVILADEDSYKGTAGANLKILANLGADIIKITGGGRLKPLSNILEHSNIVFDAIFGVGLNREISGFFRDVIELINKKSGLCGFDVICIDVPSGLNADSGEFMGTAVKYNIKHIFTFGGLKVGFYINEGESLLLDEKITLIDINQPKKLLNEYYSKTEILSPEDILPLFPDRIATATKFDYGHLLVVAGSTGKTGAAYMASLSGLRGGAGLVTAAIPSELNGIMEIKTTEIMTYPVFDYGKGFFTEKSAADIIDNALKGKTAVVIGPGIGLNSESKLFLHRLMANIAVPMIIDADALNILSQDLGILKDIGGKKDIILTPHFKEMERLTGIDRKTIARNPLKNGLDFVKEFGVNLILKGSSMFIFDKNGIESSIQVKHSTVLASGGSGDILSGLVGSFVCQGMTPLNAMKAASYIIVYSAKDLSSRYGDFGIGALEIANNIPYSVKKLKL